MIIHVNSTETIIAFDFGLKRIGVATGQMLTQTATPQTTLIAKDGIPNKIEINKLFKNFQPIAIVVGMPLDTNKEKHYISHAANKFAMRLKAKYNLPVYFVDEYNTSVQATAIIKKSLAKKKLKYGIIDKTAAAIILEKWMFEMINKKVIKL